MKENIDIGYYTKSLDGHRQSYLDFIKSKISGERIHEKSLISHKGVVFFLMIEENFLLYFVVSLIRALIGKKTVGLLFRPKPALEASNFRLKLKLNMLKFLKKIKNVKTLSIVPTPLEPSISEIVDDWIYDFQLWDITEDQVEFFSNIKSNNISNEYSENVKNIQKIKKNAGEKKIIIALGTQNKGKGTHILSENISQLVKQNFCVIVAGRFDQNSLKAKHILQEHGAYIFDRFMDDEEILALYAIADAVWCYYDPSYDQASGILGRSIQLGVLPIVRPNSFSEKFCKIENINHVASEFNIANNILNLINNQNKNSILGFEKIGLTQLNSALHKNKDVKSV